ncbi:hypothetical protein HYQ40_10110 [Aerococcaceae bacterium DSM 111021]|nr:hypothetical protein [Aerococcaceae bacterium DSM 111021]
MLKCFLLLLCIFLLVGCSSSENPMPDIEEESQSELTVSKVEQPTTQGFSQNNMADAQILLNILMLS